MVESRIVATDRLRKEKRWEEASRFRDEVRRQLRAAGKPRAEANDAAWEAMLDRYPPPEYACFLDEDEQDFAIMDAFSCRYSDLATDAIWAFSQLEAKRVRFYDAPGLAAWGLLREAREYPERFFLGTLPEALIVAEDIYDDLDETSKYLTDWRSHLAGKTPEEVKAEAGKLISEWLEKNGTQMPKPHTDALAVEAGQFAKEFL